MFLTISLRPENQWPLSSGVPRQNWACAVWSRPFFNPLGRAGRESIKRQRKAATLTWLESIGKRALRGREKALGPQRTSTLGTVNNLGNLYADQGRFNDAEAMYERAL
ncbi:hypothetical protein N657DRAFT_717609 [Parathielavia appendiculata]|uniref:Tetratricopeptide repeat protein n=1 Tax=Parathielavia appendiculata TaxID=2587402 RepID=A0AAN6TPC5_9PEZI|nr:hypothetical protein N657DRAFT_717609 [Parathielavia appendiculata]